MVHQIFAAVNHVTIETDTDQIHVTISVGVAVANADDRSPMDFYNRVDKNLYHSKRHGRMLITMD